MADGPSFDLLYAEFQKPLKGAFSVGPIAFTLHAC